jgi:hypothetical protein
MALEWSCNNGRHYMQPLQARENNVIVLRDRSRILEFSVMSKCRICQALEITDLKHPNQTGIVDSTRLSSGPEYTYVPAPQFQRSTIEATVQALDIQPY